MRKKISMYLSGMLIILTLSLSACPIVHAGSKDLNAGKRIIYQDDSTESMRDVYIRRETESKEHNQTIFSNSEESVRLLREIRDILQKLYTLEQEKDS